MSLIDNLKIVRVNDDFVCAHGFDRFIERVNEVQKQRDELLEAVVRLAIIDERINKILGSNDGDKILMNPFITLIEKITEKTWEDIQVIVGDSNKQRSDEYDTQTGNGGSVARNGDPE